MTIYGWVILAVIIAIVIIAVGIWFIRSFYRRSSKEIAFVRTGLGGQKVVIDGAAYVFPIFHDVTEVYLNTLRLSVAREKDEALISKDRMRVDVAVDFYIRVRKDAESVTIAAQTLGRKTGKPDELREMMEGKFVDALRATAAGMTLEMLHEQRSQFVLAVGQAVAESLTKNGFELESASLIDLDQTDMEYFNPSNAFDAEGLTRLTDEIEQRKKTRNDIEQDTLIQIRSKNLETEKLGLDIERESEYARLSQEKELEFRRAKQQAELTRERAERKREAKVADIMANEEMEKARIASERMLAQDRIEQQRDIEAIEIGRRQSIELAEHHRSIAVAESSEAETAARAKADAARAAAISAEEAIFTAREKAQAERKKAGGADHDGSGGGKRPVAKADPHRHGKGGGRRAGGHCAHRGRCLRPFRRDPLEGLSNSEPGRIRRGPAHGRGQQHRQPRGPGLGPAAAPGGKTGIDYPRERTPHGKDRGNQDRPPRRPDRIGRRRRHGRRGGADRPPGQQRPALPGPGPIAGSPAG
jgi:uncharacterized membrane protein YqiK